MVIRKALKDEYKTLDHVIPQCAGGKGYANNIVICCSDCNREKANHDVETFLSADEYRRDNFYNYLYLIDNQRGNKNYSEQILKKIGKSTYVNEIKPKKRKKRKKAKITKEPKKQKVVKLFEPQDIEYNIYGTDINFKINNTQRRILEFYLNNPEFTDYKELAQILQLKERVIKNNICQINNLTGIFVLKHVSQNGIKMNELFYKYLNIQNVS